MSIRYYLKKARRENQLSHKQIANLLGLKERQYQYIETGSKGTKEENWLILYKIFNRKTPIHKLMENIPVEEVFELPSGNNSSQGELAKHIEN